MVKGEIGVGEEIHGKGHVVEPLVVGRERVVGPEELVEVMRPEVVANKGIYGNPDVGFYPVALVPRLFGFVRGLEEPGQKHARGCREDAQKNVREAVHVLVDLEGHHDGQEPYLGRERGAGRGDGVTGGRGRGRAGEKGGGEVDCASNVRRMSESYLPKGRVHKPHRLQITLGRVIREPRRG